MTATNGNGHARFGRMMDDLTGGAPAPGGPLLPPHSLDAERGAIGAVLLDNDCLHDVRALLPDPAYFFRVSHGEIWGAILALADRACPVDLVTLSEELERLGRYEAIGGYEALGELMDRTPGAANAVYYAQIVRAKALGRALLSACRETLEDIERNDMTAEDLVNRACERNFKVAEGRIEETTVTAGVAASDALARLTERRDHAAGVQTGLPTLDRLTDGLQPGQVIIVAARPSLGKTALAMNIAEHAVLACARPTLFFSLEMSRLELAERLLISITGIRGDRFKSPEQMTFDEQKAIGAAYGRLREAPLYLDDAPARSVRQLAADARRWKRRAEIALVVVDYLQLVSPEASRNSSRQEQVATISRALKTLARELAVPILVLAQLNRQIELRENKRPRLADLRESGAIEQDADVVLLLHRPDYYDPNDRPGEAELIVAKNRNGALGNVPLRFDKPRMVFAEDLQRAPIGAPGDEW